MCWDRELGRPGSGDRGVHRGAPTVLDELEAPGDERGVRKAGDNGGGAVARWTRFSQQLWAEGEARRHPPTGDARGPSGGWWVSSAGGRQGWGLGTLGDFSLVPAAKGWAAQARTPLLTASLPHTRCLTCEAHGAFEGATHALEAVLDEVTQELGWGVEHLVAQLTLMVDAFLCKEKPQLSALLQATAPAGAHKAPVPPAPSPFHPQHPACREGHRHQGPFWF